MEIKDRVARGDNKYLIQELNDGTGRKALIHSPDEVIEAGTPVNRALLQPLFDGLERLDEVNQVVNQGKQEIQQATDTSVARIEAAQPIQLANNLTTTVSGKGIDAAQGPIIAEQIKKSGLKVVPATFSSNQIRVTGDFEAQADVPFLLDLTTSNLSFNSNTNIRIGSNTLALKDFSGSALESIENVGQRQFLCVKKSNYIAIELFQSKLEKRTNEAFQSARDGKIKLADAITSKGQVVDNEASFEAMASKVRDIKVGDYVAGEKIEKKDYTIHPQSKTSSSMEFNAYGSRNYYIKPYRGNYFQFWIGQSREGSGYNRVYSILYYKEVGSRYSNTISTIFKSPVYSDEYSPAVNVDLFGDMVYSASTRNDLGAICIFNMRSGKKYEKEINHGNGWYSDLVSCYSKLNVINFKFDNMKKTHVYSFIGDQIVKTGEYSYTLKEGESILDWFGKYVVVKSYNSGSRKYTLNIIDASSNSKVYSSLENSELSWSINKSYINLLVYSGNNGIYTVDLSTLANKRISAKTNLVVASLSLTDTVAFYDRDRSGYGYWQLYTPKTWRSTNWIIVHEMLGDYQDSGFRDGSGSIQHCLSEDEIGYLSARQSSNNTTRYYYYKGTICEYMTLRKRG